MLLLDLPHISKVDIPAAVSSTKEGWAGWGWVGKDEIDSEGRSLTSFGMVRLMMRVTVKVRSAREAARPGGNRGDYAPMEF